MIFYSPPSCSIIFSSSFIAINNRAAKNISVLSESECRFSISWVYAWEWNCCIICKCTYNVLRTGFPIVFQHFTFSPVKNEVFRFSIFLSTYATIYHFFIIISVGVKWYMIVVLIYTFRKNNIVDNLFMWLLTFSMDSVLFLRIFCLRGLTRSLFLNDNWRLFWTDDIWMLMSNYFDVAIKQ